MNGLKFALDHGPFVLTSQSRLCFILMISLLVQSNKIGYDIVMDKWNFKTKVHDIDHL